VSAIGSDLFFEKPLGGSINGLPNVIAQTNGDMTMTIFGQELVANRSVLGRSLATAVEICRSGAGFLAGIMRIRRDRAWLDELPDYLLRDIGVERMEIRLITRLGRKDGHGERI